MQVVDLKLFYLRLFCSIKPCTVWWLAVLSMMYNQCGNGCSGGVAGSRAGGARTRQLQWARFILYSFRGAAVRRCAQYDFCR